MTELRSPVPIPAPARPAAPDAATTPRSTMPLICSLDELVELAATHPALYLRWSGGPDADADANAAHCSDGDGGATRTRGTGVVVNPLAVEPSWGDRPLRAWLVRRLHDRRHLGERTRDARPWLLEGDEVGRGPDGEAAVACRRPIAWVARDVIDAALEEAEAQAGADEAPVR